MHVSHSVGNVTKIKPLKERFSIQTTVTLNSVLHTEKKQYSIFQVFL